MTDSTNPALCRFDALAVGSVTECVATIDGDTTSLLLMRGGDDSVHAFHNVCPHAGRSLNWAPGRFLIEDGMLICAAHGASFRIPDGDCVLGPCRGERLSEVPVVVVDGEVRLRN